MAKHKKVSLFIALLTCYGIFFPQAVDAQTPEKEINEISVIPRPLHQKVLPGNFQLTSETIISIDPDDPELQLLAGMLSDQLENLTGRETRVIESRRAQKKDAIMLTKRKAEDNLGKEGYNLTVAPEGIVLKANNGHGIFYGLQTIYQLFPSGDAANRNSLPAVEIMDKPRYKWRGLMLDVGRFFYPVDFIKKYIDYLAMHKLNTFHWHLTEDHGWRIEIKKYPELMATSAWRAGTQVNGPDQIDHRPHGGYYTQEQVKEVLEYAKRRYVNVVPEIEMPGHSLAALAAYPELSCSGGPFAMPVKWAIQKDIYCAGNEKTFQFLEDVLTEVAELFPSPVIHIGGDEAPKNRWKKCQKCQARIEAEDLKDEHELQSYFIKRIENFLRTKGKTLIGWDEILEGGLAPNASVMSWRGVKGGIEAAKQGHEVVMSPTTHLYFDYYQGDRALEPKAIGGFLPLHKVYAYDPTPPDLSPEEANYIIGTQANVWCEYIHTPEKVEYMTFPRIAALAEIAWTTPERKSWKDFLKRMETQYLRYNALGINYAKSAYNVLYDVTPAASEVTISLKTGSHDPQIYYTIDGSEPSLESLKYTVPFKIKNPSTIKAANFRNGKSVSEVSTYSVTADALEKTAGK